MFHLCPLLPSLFHGVSYAFSVPFSVPSGLQYQVIGGNCWHFLFLFFNGCNGLYIFRDVEVMGYLWIYLPFLLILWFIWKNVGGDSGWVSHHCSLNLAVFIYLYFKQDRQQQHISKNLELFCLNNHVMFYS